MSENMKTRRAALGALASIPALAIPAVAMAADSAPQPDPVFAAIEAHRAAWGAYMAASARAEHPVAREQGRLVTPEDIQARNAADAAADHTRDALLNTPPTSMAGLKAALTYFIQWDDNIPHDTLAYLQTILCSPLVA